MSFFPALTTFEKIVVHSDPAVPMLVCDNRAALMREGGRQGVFHFEE